VANGGDNNGGGTQFSTLSLTYHAGDFKNAGGILTNRTSGDQDPANHVPPSFNGHALELDNTAGNAGTNHLDFTVNTTFLTNLSLSFGIDNNGNGYTSVQLQYSINGGMFTTVGSQPMTQGTAQTVNFAAGTIGTSDFLGNGTPQSTDFRLIFSGTNLSNGKDRQTVIDNIQLNANVVPEPSTYIGGLLGIGVFCWSQRRRLIRSLGLRRV